MSLARKILSFQVESA